MDKLSGRKNYSVPETRQTVFYFSGTGNTKAVAKLFSEKTHAACHSIEEKIDFVSCVKNSETIVFCYPVYGSRVPRIMREFVSGIKHELKGKKLIIFCTQLIFSGDGARAFMDLLPRGYAEVVYAEHFFMPNNICDFFLLSVKNKEKVQRSFDAAEKKIEIIVRNIDNGIVKKRGFNIFSRLLGLSQGGYFYSFEKKWQNSIKINKDCTLCGYCVSICPMQNLEIVHSTVKQKANCTLCYRCVNNCPKKAITIIGGKIKKQYKGEGFE